MINCGREIYRAQARECAREADKSFRRYRNACSVGDREMAEFYYGAVEIYQRCMREANDKAADIIFKENNQNQPLHIVDLHCLHVDEAITKLEVRINYAITISILQLIVIVGRGIHSERGPKLKKAVTDFAFRNNIRFTSDHLNTGRINLCLKNMSQIPPLEQGAVNFTSSMYLYNRPKQVKLSDYIIQTSLKDSKRNGSRVSDSSKKVSTSVKKLQQKRRDSTHLQQNFNQLVDSGTSKKRKCNTQRENDRSNDVPSTVKKSKTEIRNATLILQDSNQLVDSGTQGASEQTSNTERKNTTLILQDSNQLVDSGPQGASDCANEVSSLVITTQIQHKDSTYIMQSGNVFSNLLSRLRSSGFGFLFGFVLIGVMLRGLGGL